MKKNTVHNSDIPEPTAKQIAGATARIGLVTTTDQLRDLIRQHHLRRTDVVQILADAGITASIHTINAWLLPASNRAHRKMQADTLYVLRAELLNK